VTDAVRLEVSGAVATLTLDRPESRNALSPDIVNGLGDGLSVAIADPQVRVIVLTNEGNTFCAGADLRQARPMEPARWSLPQILGELILDSPKPVVGKIAGHCMGGGVGLAAACDVSIAADDVLVGFTEVRIGVAPAIISVVCLPKMRRADASELFLSGERINASRAADVGLINRAVARADLNDEVTATVGRLLAGGPHALAASKQLIARVPDLDRQAAFTWTERMSKDLFASEEAAAGMKAFKERAAPPWV